MIEKLANYIANRIKAADPEGTTSVEVMEYALGVIFNMVFTVLLSCLIGWFSGELIETMIAVVGFGVLRYFSGGIHMRSLTACTIVSTAIFSIVPHIVLSSSIVLILNGIAALIMLFFSPNTYYEETINPAKPALSNTGMRAASVLIVATNFYFSSSTLVLVFLIQAILILPRKGGVIDAEKCGTETV